MAQAFSWLTPVTIRGRYIGLALLLFCVSAVLGDEGQSSLVPVVGGQKAEMTPFRLSFRSCPPGKFLIGSPDSDPLRRFNETREEVTLTHGFWIQEHEVTQKLWEDVMQSSPWSERGKDGNFRSGDKFAATYMTFSEATEFCQKLNDTERRSGRLPKEMEFQLPTQAQWEYACRANLPSA